MQKQLIISYVFVVILFLTFQLSVTYNVNICTRDKNHYKVAIVGAGIAGIGAATYLMHNNVTDILILEASNRVGGRIYTAPFGDFVVEMGCQWVHGQDGNVVYEIAEPYGVLYIQNSDLVPTLMKQPQSKVDMDLARPLFRDALDLFEHDEEMQACKCSMGEFFDKNYDKMAKERRIDEHTKQAVRDLIIKVQGIEDGTDDLSREGATGNTNYWIPPGSVSVAWKSGYSTIIDLITGKYQGNELPVMNKVKFNKIVQNINWSGNDVEISCKDGSQYSADYVIVTVSLGVLKNSANTMFTPALPPNKLKAIEMFGFDVVNKIFIQFSTRWWPMEYEFHRNFLWSDEDKRKFKQQSRHGGWATEITSFHFVVNQPRVLEGWVVGKVAHQLELMSEKEVLDGCMEMLHWFFGDKHTISEPIDIVRSQWSNYDFVRGSYSFPTTESDRLRLSPNDLAEPLKHNNRQPSVLFAGEATHDHYYSTVHGALETGWREAKRILDLL